MKQIKVGFGNKIFYLDVKKLSYAGFLTGLMFKSKNSENLLFDMPGEWGIHSFFVFFPFLALWLDEKNNVVDWKIVKPFSLFVKPKRKFSKLVEIPLNLKSQKIISIFRR